MGPLETSVLWTDLTWRKSLLLVCSSLAEQCFCAVEAVYGSLAIMGEVLERECKNLGILSLFIGFLLVLQDCFDMHDEMTGYEINSLLGLEYNNFGISVNKQLHSKDPEAMTQEIVYFEYYEWLPA